MSGVYRLAPAMKYTLGLAPWSRSARAIATAFSVTEGNGNRVKHKKESGCQPFGPQSLLPDLLHRPRRFSRARLAVRTRRPARVGRERAIHRVEIAADDSRVEVRGRDFRMASQETHRRVLGAHVIRSPSDVMVGARVVEEERDRFHDLPPKVREVGTGFHKVLPGSTGCHRVLFDGVLRGSGSGPRACQEFRVWSYWSR